MADDDRKPWDEEQEREEEERIDHEGFGASRHWGGFGSDHDERGLADRLSDEVRSWFGDDDATRRRRQDRHQQ